MLAKRPTEPTLSASKPKFADIRVRVLVLLDYRGPWNKRGQQKAAQTLAARCTAMCLSSEEKHTRRYGCVITAIRSAGDE